MDEEEEDPNEVDNLYKEATMPIEEVISKNYDEEDEGGNNDLDGLKKKNPQMAALIGESSKKPISPFLRAKSESKPNTHIKFNQDDDDKDNKGDVKEVKEVNGEGVNGHEEEKENGNGNGHAHNGKEEEEEEEKAKGEEEKAGVENEEEGGDKGKGKGKGKGKSGMVKKKVEIDQDEKEDAEIIKKMEEERKAKKAQRMTGQELYEKMAKDGLDEEEMDDEDDDDDSEDDDDDDDDDEEGDGEEEEEDDDEDEDDTEDEEEGEDEEDGIIGGDFNEEPGNDSGCTAVVALIKGRKVYVANAGDSRCVISRSGKAIEMSFDHKPEDEPEMTRIVTAGGKVTPDGRVNGGLNLSRAIGDHAYKKNKSLGLTQQMISAEPDVKTLDLLDDEDEFVFLACDGIWNSMNSQEVVDFISERLKKMEGQRDKKLSKICEEVRNG